MFTWQLASGLALLATLWCMTFWKQTTFLLGGKWLFGKQAILEDCAREKKIKYWKSPWSSLSPYDENQTINNSDFGGKQLHSYLQCKPSVIWYLKCKSLHYSETRTCAVLKLEAVGTFTNVTPNKEVVLNKVAVCNSLLFQNAPYVKYMPLGLDSHTDNRRGKCDVFIGSLHVLSKFLMYVN